MLWRFVLGPLQLDRPVPEMPRAAVDLIYGETLKLKKDLLVDSATDLPTSDQ